MGQYYICYDPLQRVKVVKKGKFMCYVITVLCNYLNIFKIFVILYLLFNIDFFNQYGRQQK